MVHPLHHTSCSFVAERFTPLFLFHDLLVVVVVVVVAVVVVVVVVVVFIV